MDGIEIHALPPREDVGHEVRHGAPEGGKGADVLEGKVHGCDVDKKCDQRRLRIDYGIPTSRPPHLWEPHFCVVVLFRLLDTEVRGSSLWEKDRHGVE